MNSNNKSEETDSNLRNPIKISSFTISKREFQEIIDIDWYVLMHLFVEYLEDE